MSQQTVPLLDVRDLHVNYGAVSALHGFLDDLEAEYHVGARIAVGHREHIDLVDVFTALEQALETGAQALQHALGIQVRDGLAQFIPRQLKSRT